MPSSKRKRKSCSNDSVDESIVKKKRKSVSPENTCDKGGEEIDSVEEHSRLLGQVTGQIQRLPLEDKTEVNEAETSRKKRKRRGGDYVGQERTEGLTNREESSVDKTSASQYLELWDSDRANWSFRKKTQYWLLQNMYFKHSVSLFFLLFSQECTYFYCCCRCQN